MSEVSALLCSLVTTRGSCLGGALELQLWPGLVVCRRTVTVDTRGESRMSGTSFVTYYH